MISELEAAHIAHEYYGLEGKARALAGEYDLNFRIETHDAMYLLKIVVATSDRAALE